VTAVGATADLLPLNDYGHPWAPQRQKKFASIHKQNLTKFVSRSGRSLVPVQSMKSKTNYDLSDLSMRKIELLRPAKIETGGVPRLEGLRTI